MQPAALIITKSDVRSTVHRRASHGLCRRQAVRQRWRSFRRIARHRALHLIGLYPEPQRHSAPAQEARSGSWRQAAFRLPAIPARRSISSPRKLSARRAVPDRCRSSGRDGAGILRLEERPRTRLFVRRDKFDRFVSAFVFIPRDRFDSDVRRKVGEYAGRGLRRAGGELRAHPSAKVRWCASISSSCAMPARSRTPDLASAGTDDRGDGAQLG